jgi:hypothetical protein
MLENPKFWLLIIGMPLVAIVPDLTINVAHRVFKPTPTDCVMLE